LHQAESGDPVAWIFNKTQERQDVSDVRGVEEFETAVFNEWDIPPRQLDFDRSAMMRRAEQDRLLLQRRPALPIFQDTLHDVARLIGFVAHADEPRSCAGISVGPKVLGEALSCQTDHAICRREDCLVER
jgi:hypothetical protein